MTLFDELKAKKILRIEQFIADKTTENQKLEFKRVLQMKPSGALDNEGKRNLSKQVSGFANGAGGILIHGIQTEKQDSADVAKTLHPIQNITAYKNRVEAALAELITPEIIGVEIIEIFHDKDEKSGYLAFSIPQSELRPHMATASKEHKYYRRGLESTTIMDHSQIRDMFFTQKSPLLVHKIRPIWSGNSGKVLTIDFIFSLKNIGQASAKNPVLRVEYNPKIQNISPSNLRIRTIDEKISYFLKQDDVLYTEDEAIFARPRIYLHLDETSLSEFSDEDKNNKAKKPSNWFFSQSRSNKIIAQGNPKDLGFNKIEFKILLSAENGVTSLKTDSINVSEVFKVLEDNSKFYEWLDRTIPPSPSPK